MKRITALALALALAMSLTACGQKTETQETGQPTYDGAAAIQTDQERYLLDAGDVLIIPSGNRYQLLPPESKAVYIALNFDYTQSNISFTIHVDCGVNGPSGAVIPEVVGYIHAMGYECEIKPDSPIASCIADRISK